MGLDPCHVQKATVMLNMPSFARDLKPGEEGVVDDLLRAAFGGPAEAQLVHKLRRSRAIAGEQVMPMGDRIVGYYALSYLRKPKGWLALAPVAIAPDVQGRGYGKRMMGMLSEWARLTRTPVVVLGPLGFYTKAGFSHEATQNLTSPYPAAHLSVAGVSDAPQHDLIYPQAFDGI